MTKSRLKSETSVQNPSPDLVANMVNYGSLDERIGYHLRRAQITVFADFYKAFEALNLRPVQYSILTIIEHNPGLLQTQVADALGIRKANFVALIVALEKRGLVERIQQKNDRRSYGLYLSAAGQNLMPELHRLALAHEQRIIDRIGQDVHAELFGTLKRIARE